MNARFKEKERILAEIDELATDVELDATTSALDRIERIAADISAYDEDYADEIADAALVERAIDLADEEGTL